MEGLGSQDGGAKSTLEFHFLKYITNQRPLGESKPSGSPLKLWSILEGTLVLLVTTSSTRWVSSFSVYPESFLVKDIKLCS